MVKANETFVWNGQKPWDGIGQHINNDMTTTEMMNAAKLNWEVEPKQTYFETDKGRVATKQYALVRDDEPDQALTFIPEKNWHILQNSDMFAFFEKYIESRQLRLLSAGSLKGGRLVWVMAEVGDLQEIYKNDVFQNNVLFTLPHLYGKAIDIRQTPLRISCNNMISLALGRNNKHLTIRCDHRQKFDAEVVQHALGMADVQFKELRETAHILANRVYTQDLLEEYLQDVFPKISTDSEKEHTLSKPAMTVLKYMDEQPGAEHAYGTWWQAVQAVTFSTNHIFGQSAETRLASQWYGSNQRVNVESITKALEYSRK